MKIHTFFFYCLLFCQLGFAQKNDTVDFYNKIKNQDITEFILVSNKSIGFMGDDYQRFYIHFTSVEKSKNNPYQYMVKGKTKIKENICSFIGTVTIKTAITFKGDENDEEIPKNIRQGKFTANLALQEDKHQYGSGTITGILMKGFILKANKLADDNLLYYGDMAYEGNVFEGKWTSYTTQKLKRCMWHNGGGWTMNQDLFQVGDDGDVYINHKYLKNGWENYVLAWHPESLNIEYNDPQVEKSRTIEKEIWWK